MKDKHKPRGVLLVMPFQAQVAVFDCFSVSRHCVLDDANRAISTVQF